MGIKDEEKTKQQLISEVKGLRKELLQIKADPSGIDTALRARSGLDEPVFLSDSEASDLIWNLDEENLPTIDELPEKGESHRVLDFGRENARSFGEERQAGRKVTESGSFDLRWMRLAGLGRILQSVPMPILLIDLDGTIRFANDEFLCLREFDEDTPLAGESFYSYFTEPGEADQVRGLCAGVHEYRRPEFREGPLKFGEKRIWTRMNLRSLRYGDSRAIMVVIEDLSAEKRELTLNEKYRNLVHHFPTAIAEFALRRPVSCNVSPHKILPIILEAEVTHGNIEFAGLHGFNELQDLTGLRLGDVFPCEGKTQDLYLKWIRNRFSISSLETKEVGTEGEIRYFEDTLLGNVRDDTIQEFWGMRRDITERKRVEQKLVEKIRTIDELYEHILQSGRSKIIADHTAAVAHELRQPLAIIGGFARRMVRELGRADHDRQREWLGLMIREVERLERILRGFIDFTRRESIHLRLVDPNELIEYVLLINEERMREKRIFPETYLGEEIGEIPLDPDRFQHVVRNLVSNAIEASPPDMAITVETGVSIPSEKACSSGNLNAEAYFEMRIHNAGKSLLPDDVQNVFSPFFTTKEYGTGIGLTLTRKITEEHNGYISVKSDETGTLFTVWIPVDQEQLTH
jgi:PAS domain S-box-containing protein